MSVDSKYRPEAYKLLEWLDNPEGLPWEEPVPEYEVWVFYCEREGLVEYTPYLDGFELNITKLGQLALRLRNNPAVDETGRQPVKPIVKSEVSLDARALGVFIEHPDWTKKRIATHLKCNEKSLCPERCPKLAAAIAAHKAPVDPCRRRLRGSKDADGNLEAWEDE